MSNNKSSAEEKSSTRILNEIIEDINSYKKPSARSASNGKENAEPKNESTTDNVQPTRPKSIGHYILGKTIGEGTFGKVKLATHILTGEKVAIKILEKARISDVADVERVAREIHILKLIRHPNIIHLYEIIETPKQLYLVMEYARGGELFDYIVAHTRVKEHDACRFFHQIISGIEYIHQLNIVHRDLKPENLLFDLDKSIKIVDFGLSNTYQNKELLKTACGSPCYAAPEMIAGKKYEGLMVDIWSCGVILFAMVCGYLPFEDPNTSALYKKILSGEYTIPKFVSSEAKDLIKNILNTNPDKRYTIANIRNHPWMNQVKLLREPVGIIVGLHKIPIDYEILRNCEKYGFNLDYVEKCLDANKHNHVTTSYYLMLRKHLQNGGKSSADYNSESFVRENIKHTAHRSKHRSVMKNNYMGNGSDNNISRTDEKDKSKDVSFNEDKLAEELVRQIQQKNRRYLEAKQPNFLGDSSTADPDHSLNATFHNSVLNSSINRPILTDIKRRVSNSRDYSSDSKHNNSYLHNTSYVHAKENYDINPLNERFTDNAYHHPIVKKNYYQQQSVQNQHRQDGLHAVSVNRDPGNQSQLQGKLRDMLQNRMTNNFVQPNAGGHNSPRSYKKPKDLSLHNDIFEDSIRSDLKSIGNSTSLNPHILDEITSNNTHKRANSSIHSTPKEEATNSHSKHSHISHYQNSRDYSILNESMNMSTLNESLRHSSVRHRRSPSTVSNQRPMTHQAPKVIARRPSTQQQPQNLPTKPMMQHVQREPKTRPLVLPNKDTAYRTKQFLSKQAHTRTASTGQQNQRPGVVASIPYEKMRSSSQQGRKDRVNQSVRHDSSMNNSNNGSFAVDTSYNGPTHQVRHSHNHSLDMPGHIRSVSKGSALDSSMYYTGERHRKYVEEANISSKLYSSNISRDSSAQAQRRSVKKY